MLSLFILIIFHLDYGKLIHMLMDSQNPDIQRLLGKRINKYPVLNLEKKILIGTCIIFYIKNLQSNWYISDVR